jgi:hypothetical protein
MLEASNLGQVIGRLMYGELEPAPAEGPAAPRPVVRICRRGKAKEIVELLARHGNREGLLAREVAEVLKLNVNIASAYLSQMEEVEKLGDRRPHRYRLVSDG